MLFGAPYTGIMREGLLPFGQVLQYAADQLRQGTKELFVPVRIVDALHAMRCPDLFPRAVAPSESNLKLFDSHPAFFRWMSESGLSEYAPAPASCFFPCIVKDSAGGYGGQSVRVCRDPEEMRRALSSAVHLGLEAIAQELVPGTDEYVGHFLVFRGEVLESGIRRVKLPTPFSKKVTIQPGTPVEVDETPFREIFYRTSYSGFACANFKLRDCGRPVLFEINPRIGESLCHQPNRPLLERMLARLPDTF
jgi:predicted ATP-grasp superfamily ATP-dependent carboligase